MKGERSETNESSEWGHVRSSGAISGGLRRSLEGTVRSISLPGSGFRKRAECAATALYILWEVLTTGSDIITLIRLNNKKIACLERL